MKIFLKILPVLIAFGLIFAANLLLNHIPNLPTTLVGAIMVIFGGVIGVEVVLPWGE